MKGQTPKLVVELYFCLQRLFSEFFTSHQLAVYTAQAMMHELVEMTV